MVICGWWMLELRPGVDLHEGHAWHIELYSPEDCASALLLINGMHNQLHAQSFNGERLRVFDLYLVAIAYWMPYQIVPCCPDSWYVSMRRTSQQIGSRPLSNKALFWVPFSECLLCSAQVWFIVMQLRTIIMQWSLDTTNPFEPWKRVCCTQGFGVSILSQQHACESALQPWRANGANNRVHTMAGKVGAQSCKTCQKWLAVPFFRFFQNTRDCTPF